MGSMVGSGIPSLLCSWSEYFAGSDNEGPETVLTNSPAVFFLIL